MSRWTLFSNHGHVLVCLASDSESRLRDVATAVGITERAVQKIVRDLQNSGMISVTKHGRRNRYRIHHKKTLRHNLEAHCTLGELVNLVTQNKPANGENENHKSVDLQEDPVEPTEPVVATLEPFQREVIKPEQTVTKPAELKQAKSITPESIERQQGSLF